MKRKPTKQEEQQLLKTIKDGFLIGLKSLLGNPVYKNIDFTKTLKDAVKRGEIIINKNGVIMYLWDPTKEVGDIPTGIHNASDIENLHSKNEMKKSQLKMLVKEVLREMAHGGRSNVSDTYDGYEIEFESLAIPDISTENDAVTVTVSIQYNANAGYEPRGMFGPPEHSDPGEGASVEVVDYWPTSVVVWGPEMGDNQREYDPEKLTPEQQAVLKKAIENHMTQNESKIDDMLLDKIDFDYVYE
jgi:hypothetical protein